MHVNHLQFRQELKSVQSNASRLNIKTHPPEFKETFLRTNIFIHQTLQLSHNSNKEKIKNEGLCGGAERDFLTAICGAVIEQYVPLSNRGEKNKHKAIYSKHSSCVL